MDEIKLFVKEKALEAAMREKVTTPQELPHTKEKKVEKESSSVGAEEQCALSSDQMEEPCILSCDKMASANYEDAHVKNQGDDGWDTITPNPFENLEPLPCELPNCSDQAFWNDVIFWAEIPLVVHDYKPQTGMFGDEDLSNTQQASCLMDEVSFDRCHQEEKQVVVAESGFQSVFVSKSNGDSCTLNLQSWAFESFDLAVQDPSQVMDVLS
ncbi:unnamed protein product [Sphagnum troendelagicum]